MAKTKENSMTFVFDGEGMENEGVATPEAPATEGTQENEGEGEAATE